MNLQAVDRPKRRRADTVERLLDAALDTFAEIGFAAASVEDICRRGGFTRGAFYSSFRTKDELFGALFARETARNLARAEQQLAAGLKKATRPDKKVQLSVVAFGSKPEGMAMKKALKPVDVYVDVTNVAADIPAAFVHVAAGGLEHH